MLAGRAAVWHGGQLETGASQEGKPLTYFKNTSNLSSVEKSRWGMSTMTEFCGEAGL